MAHIDRTSSPAGTGGTGGGRIREELPWNPMPGAQFNPPWLRGRDPDITTVPEGFRDPDRFGRMRPPVNPYAAQIDNNPMRGANIGGGWNLYEGGPSPQRRWERMNQQIETPMGSGAYLSSRYGLGNQFARNAGANGMLENMLMASGPGMDDDDYGPFIPSSVLEMDIEDIIYGPSDEYDFDRKRGYPGQIWGKPPVYSARGGLIS